MIALYLDPLIARELAFSPSIELDAEGGSVVFPEDLHVTLAYFPYVEDKDSLIQRAAFLANARGVVASRVAGRGQFTPDEGEPVPHVLLMDPENLYWLATEARNSPGASKKHGYIPHITLAYAPDTVYLNAEPPPDVVLTFPRLTLICTDKLGMSTRYDFSFQEEYPLVYRVLQAKLDGRASEGQVKDENLIAAAIEMQETQVTKAKPSLKDKMASMLRASLKRAPQNELLEADDPALDAQIKERGFAVFKDAETGAPRWIAFSSNGFEDVEGEIVSTQSLIDAVKTADDTGKRGPLRLFHIPGGKADIGDCDFQAVEERFLIESGTFRDTPLGQNALKYLMQAEPDEIGVSIGFTSAIKDFKDGVYTGKINIFERSIAPKAVVANPWTAFRTIREEPMDQVKVDFLNKIAGEDLASDLIKSAGTATKALEGSVRYKTVDLGPTLISLAKVTEGLAEITKSLSEAATAEIVVLDSAGPEEDEEDEGEEGDATEEAAEGEGEEGKDEDEEGSDGVTASKLAETFAAVITPLISPITDQLTQVTSRLDQQEAQIKELTKGKTSAPRAAKVFRASAEGASPGAEATKTLEETARENPVAAFIQDLTGANRNG